MNEVAVSEFPFVEDLPKREKSKLQMLWDEVHAMGKVMDKTGLLIPYPAAGLLGGVSRQRIDQLCDAGILQRVDFAGRPYVTEHSLVAWAKSQRANGRPVGSFADVVRKTWKSAYSGAQARQKKK